MQKVFGIPIDTLLVVLVVALVGALGIVAVLAIRHPVLVKLGVRNVGRRRGRTALIVVGLMLGTTIVAGPDDRRHDESHDSRSGRRTLGQTDELVSAKGTEVSLGTNLGSATGVEYFDEDVSDIDAALAGTALVDGITPAVIEEVAVQAAGTAPERAPRDPVRGRPRPHGGFGDHRRELRRGHARRPLAR